SLRVGPAERAALTRPEALAELARAAWPGNVRELRNHLERSLVFPDADADAPAEPTAGPDIDPAVPFVAARDHAVAHFERRYLEALLTAHGGKMAPAAAAAGIHRVYLYRLLKKHRLGRT